MNTPNLTPETIDRLSDVAFPTTYNWAVRRLAGYREQLAQYRKMSDTLEHLNDEGNYTITLSSTLIPSRTVTLNASDIGSGDVIGAIIQSFGQREHFFVDQVLSALLDIKNPEGEHQQDINSGSAPARLEVLRLVLTPEEYDAITAPPPMCGPGIASPNSDHLA